MVQPYSAPHSQCGACEVQQELLQAKVNASLQNKKGGTRLLMVAELKLLTTLLLFTLTCQARSFRYSATVLSHYPSTARRHQTACILQDKVYCPLKSMCTHHTLQRLCLKTETVTNESSFPYMQLELSQSAAWAYASNMAVYTESANQQPARLKSLKTYT